MSGAERYTNSPKIDAKAVDGATGVYNSLAYRVDEIEHHVHSRERWLGISGDQSGNNWAADNLNPFVAISGANDYGGDADDEAKVLGTDDTPIIAGSLKYDLHRLLVLDVDHDTVYKLRIVYGTGTMGDAITAGQYSEVVVLFDSTNPTVSAGSPVDLQMARLDVGTDKVWIQAWNASNNSNIDFLVGIHEYDG